MRSLLRLPNLLILRPINALGDWLVPDCEPIRWPHIAGAAAAWLFVAVLMTLGDGAGF